MARDVGNWGRWGTDDQRGALNLATAEVVRAALGCVKRGEVVSLSVPLHASATPRVPFRAPALHFMTVDGGDYAAGAARGQGGFQLADDFILMPVHSGTHVDALSHVGRSGSMYNGYPTTDVRSTRGARSLGIEHFSGLVTRALVLDFCAAMNGQPLEDGTEIGVPELEAALERSGGELRPGDAVLLHTGWLERFDGGEELEFESEPGLGVDAARWLAARDVVLIGADNFGVEVVPSPDGDTMPVHIVCLQEHGIHLMELLDLRPLLRAGVSECVLVVAPLRITGGVGSPVNPIAIF